MRLKDPNGAWKCSDQDARIMRRREIDEEDGTYYHLLTEGLIRNYDGITVPVAPPRQGLDINRNYPFEWAPEGTQRGAGPYPISEPETRAQAEFWRTHPNISGFLTYHTRNWVPWTSVAGMANSISKMRRCNISQSCVSSIAVLPWRTLRSAPISICARCRWSRVAPNCGISLWWCKTMAFCPPIPARRLW